jgi:acyl-CoA reductase-like NAD-dependent aldehyde dehydrogenase
MTPWHRDLLIDGGWRSSADRGGMRDDEPQRAGGRRSVVISDPATGELVGTSAVAGPADVDTAVEAAARAQPEWARTPPGERAVILHAAADRIASAVDEIALLLTREQGKPVVDSRKEILFGVEVLHYYAEEAKRVSGSVRPSTRSDVRSVVMYAPAGVVAAIVPWNYPVDLYCWKVAPALAAGCAVIAKPPFETPLAIGEVARCLQAAGLPPGLLGDLPGDGTVGARLAAHSGVHMVTVTGSTATGRAVMQAASHGLKRLSLELGGHTPFIVLDDADVEEAVAACTRRSFSNMGQICIAVNRVLVDERVADAFVDALALQADKLEVGHGVDGGVQYGPMLNGAVRTRADGHVRDALARGGVLRAGGHVPAGTSFERGSFYRPTVIDHVPPDALMMTEETFGPAVGIHRLTGDAALLEAANRLPYGLAAYVYSGDLERAWAFAERVEAGGVGINVNDVTELQAPFGGWKLSGSGRELGPEGLMTYLESRHLRMRVRPFESFASGG